MNSTRIAHAWAILFFLAGCDLTAPTSAPPPPISGAPSRESGPATVGPAVAPRSHEAEASVSGDTKRDFRFAEFVRDKAGPLVREVSVGVERKGLIQIVLGEATAPADTLPLTQSLVAGARKDFPDRPFTLVVFDPAQEPILKAHSSPEGGVRYEVPGAGRAVHESAAQPTATPTEDREPTAKDRRFADWAMKTGHDYLRFVESDLDRTGLLVFGIRETVDPKDVRDLTRSLLEGARTEFPRRSLAAIVVDPNGQRIGKATLDADGQVHWNE